MEFSKTPFRPSLLELPDDVNKLIVDVMEECWKEDPKDRFNIKQAKGLIDQINRGRCVRLYVRSREVMGSKQR